MLAGVLCMLIFIMAIIAASIPYWKQGKSIFPQILLREETLLYIENGPHTLPSETLSRRQRKPVQTWPQSLIRLQPNSTSRHPGRQVTTGSGFLRRALTMAETMFAATGQYVLSV